MPHDTLQPPSSKVVAGQQDSPMKVIDDELAKFKAMSGSVVAEGASNRFYCKNDIFKNKITKRFVREDTSIVA